ncbi:hypothetical protein V8E54_005162 [Elaphomyces granulatus]
MDERYWPEFIRDATYKANRTPIQRLNWRTPIEFITGRQPYLGHLRKISYPEHTSIERMSRDVRIDETVLYSSEQTELEPRLKFAIDEILDIIEIPTHEPPQFFETSSIPDPPPRYPVLTSPDDTTNVGGCDTVEDAENTLPTPRETPPSHNQDTENTAKVESSDNDPVPTLTQTQQKRRPRDKSEGLSEEAIIPTTAPYATRMLSVSYKTDLVSIVINFRHRLGRTPNFKNIHTNANSGKPWTSNSTP